MYTSSIFVIASLPSPAPQQPNPFPSPPSPYQSCRLEPTPVHNLPLLHLGRHGRIQLGEALAQAGLGGHGLGDAAADAARLAAREGLGGEVVDAGAEAVVY